MASQLENSKEELRNLKLFMVKNLKILKALRKLKLWKKDIGPIS